MFDDKFDGCHLALNSRKGIFHRWRNYTLVLISLLFCAKLHATLTTEDFARDLKFAGASLSPDGKHLALGLIHEGKRRLMVLDTGTHKLVGGANLGERQQVGDFYWVNNERLVIKILRHKASRAQPGFYGELFAVNYDGKKAEMIYGYRAGGRSNTRIKQKQATYGWAEIVSLLPDDPKHILISSTPMSADGARVPSVFRLNVYTGKMRKTGYHGPAAHTRYLSDRDGTVHLAVSRNKDNKQQVFRRNADNSGWLELGEEKFGKSFYPLAVDSTAQHAYVLDSYRQDHLGLFKIDLTSGDMQHIYTEPGTDVTSAVFSTDLSTVYALRVDPGYPEYLVFNDKSEEARVFKDLLATFNGYQVNITSQSSDGAKWVVYANSDTDPGTYYLYDKHKNALTRLFDSLPELKSDQLPTTAPVQFKASDGQLLKGYVTYPEQPDDTGPWPLVVLVHGGPHGVRDYHVFDREVQLLANQGYAVLRVNYRGSGGYGQQFMEAGYKRWGDRIQQDIIDGTRWLAAQQQIDGDRVCIMGASFGGYSAVQSTILAPDLFRCAVATAGIYDLELMFEAGDVPKRIFGEAFLESVIGLDETQLAAFSPVNHLHKLQAPLLIAHGENDERAPIDHAIALRKGLQALDKPFEWFVKDTEGHGFYRQQNRAEYYHRVVDFLAEHLAADTDGELIVAK